MPDAIHDHEIEAFIRTVFEENFEQLQIESGHSISPDVKEAALQQALLYWHRLREIATRVTDTEVHLSLPGQESPRGREFTIEGVVDILSEEGRVVMYDIKTHEADYVRANLELYKQQLNVYAHIWQELRGQQLDESAVIATRFPDTVKAALESGDPAHLAYALGNWDPVVPVPYDAGKKDETLANFARVVDQIEDGEFTPAPVIKLKEQLPGTREERFAVRVCRNCDARFSCSSYREYAMGRRRLAERGLEYFIEDDPDQEAWRTANLEASA